MKRFFCLLLVAFAFMAPTCPKASADVVLIEKLTVDTSHVTINGKPVPAGEETMFATVISAMAPFGDTTFSATKTNLRVDNQFYSIIFKKDDNTALLLFQPLKQYMIVSTSVLADVNSHLSASTTSAITVTDMHKTDTILGHTAKEYLFTVQNAPVVISGNIWSCEEFPELSSLNTLATSTNQWTNLVLNKIKGVPLKVACSLDNSSMFTGIKLSMAANSITTDPIPATAFQAPKDYTKIETNNTNSAAQLKDAIERTMEQVLFSSVSKESKTDTKDVAPAK